MSDIPSTIYVRFDGQVHNAHLGKSEQYATVGFEILGKKSAGRTRKRLSSGSQHADEDLKSHQAEYRSAIEALQHTRRVYDTNVTVVLQGDSESVMNCIDETASASPHAEKDAQFVSEIQELLSSFDSYEIECISREKNKWADRLAEDA